MKREALGILLLGLSLAACAPLPTEPTVPAPTVINISNTNTNTQGGGPSASPSPGSGVCLAVDEVGNALLGGTGQREANLQIGQGLALDTTPRSKGQLRPDACNLLSRVVWTMQNSPSNACTLANDNTYTPTVTARALGSCEIRSNIDGIPATVPITITVRAATLLRAATPLETMPGVYAGWSTR